MRIEYKDFIIKSDPECYEIFRKGTIQKEDSPRFGEEIERSLGKFPTTIERAIEIITRIEQHEKNETYTLDQFLVEFKKLRAEITEHFNGA